MCAPRSEVPHLVLRGVSQKAEAPDEAALPGRYLIGMALRRAPKDAVTTLNIEHMDGKLGLSPPFCNNARAIVHNPQAAIGVAAADPHLGTAASALSGKFRTETLRPHNRPLHRLERSV
jgi:hypothetical protein